MQDLPPFIKGFATIPIAYIPPKNNKYKKC